VLSPDGQQVAADYFDASTGTRLGYWGHDGPVPLVPGTYYIAINQSTGVPFALASGETKDMQLGAVQVDGSFEIWAADGTRLGYYGDTLFLVPGTYTIELDDGTVVENVIVQPGQTTIVD
jgi:hypothetical protein